MADILKQSEAIPAAYPDAPAGLSTAAAALDADMLWQRIESYIAHRWTARAVVWTLEGSEGEDWQPPLAPVNSHTAEKWESGAWVSVTLASGPLGLCLPSDGTFKVTADVGGGDVPAAVSEAFRRLAEYSAEIGKDGMLPGHGAVTSHSVGLGGDIQESFDRPATWAARALINSGAADLLRPYRKA